ncbi:GNAT family N-acetyltransferase [Piscinibacter terrae]|uniref:Aminotransferase class V-fold PLP-dependent enzyme n=1 Tax=Piscinibacter terrae TaxID=2496871 RepID=A0A3N7HIS2_9BURK|nr:GNAT family N-acetyltransferase [Albitalea terrae]RQP21393.1 aminotransferase class V-fold PLP-dependent enzyme [Albitalea terrae]
MNGSLRFKVADTPAEFEAIHRLNYRTFVEEIPQHPPNEARRLVDRFHAENTYAVCMDGDALVGMIAGRCNRPFSLDQKLADIDAFLPPHRKIVEVRLLAVDRPYRKREVFARLAGVLATCFRSQGCDVAIISGTLRETRLYQHLGFRPFGPLVGQAPAQFQPMVLTLDDYAGHVAHLEAMGGRRETCLMPGPVAVRAAVSEAFARAPISHRSAEFKGMLGRVRGRLQALSGAHDALVMPGSGTLANDAIGAQLATQGRPGVVLSNGEFGDRLIEHARRWRLPLHVLRAGWGQGFDAVQLQALMARARPSWVWMVACETSTGVRNDLGPVRALCREHGADLCVDAVSALGLQAIDLSGVRFASAVSGKALGAYPGLAIVCHDGRLADVGSVPRCLDLAMCRDTGGVPFTQSSNLVAALDAAMDLDWPPRWREVAAADRLLRDELRRRGFSLVAREGMAMPGVITVALGPQIPAARLARRMERSGYRIAHQSEYLIRRNWVQLCLMGEWDPHAVEILPDVFATNARACAERVPTRRSDSAPRIETVPG